MVEKVRSESGDRIKKIEKMKALLQADPSDSNAINFKNFEPLPLPLDPDVKICRVLPEKTYIFRSALAPSKLSFITDENEEYVIIIKCEDDLRQDQLILQIITLMDRILQKENLDLKLSPYK